MAKTKKPSIDKVMPQPIIHHFKVHTAALLKEICDNTLTMGNNGILKIPLNVFRGLLCQVAERAAQINDPILNQLMCDLTMYEVADPWSKEYDVKVLDYVRKKSDEQRLKEQ